MCRCPEIGWDGGDTPNSHLLIEYSNHRIDRSCPEGDREDCLEAGMNEYINKPIRMKELQKALKG